MPPTIAIVGSVDPARKAELRLSDTEQAQAACRQLGEELALQGFHIIVFHGNAMFVEGDIVAGYIGSKKAAPKSIQVRYAEGETDAGTFPEMASHRACFEPKRSGDDWEVSFYRAMKDADGVLLIGGGRSTLIAGSIAVSFSKPTVAVSTFGGKAREVRRELDRAKNDTTAAHLEAMAAPWGDDSARALVTSLIEQRQRHDDAEARALGAVRKEGRRKRISGGVAAGFAALALAAVLVVRSADPGSTVSIAALFLAPALTGVSGAIVRNVRDEGTDWWMAACLGFVAGLLASALFVASQLLTSEKALDSPGVRTLAWIMLVGGFIAGLTTDRVFDKMSSVDVTDVTPLEKKG